uniref:Tethering factor for nuclear proteasome STS1 n=1 Tax=Lygus hesperus TaxID=30085 RepID=A0A0A9WHQ2_LYGHE
METPPPEPPTRRNTRSALIEIPARLSALSVNDRGNGRVHANIMTNLMFDNVEESNRHLALISPAPSPDELVIQARGRRRLPLTWSPPDFHYTPPGNRPRSPAKERTPVKQQSTIVLRSTPRKRLLMPDPHDPPSSPEKKSSPNPKKVRIELPMPAFQGPIESALKALSPDQLISVIQNVIIRHPNLEEDIRKNLPAPDLRPIKDKLNELKRNIYKSLPNSRLTSKTDSPAYNRAATHVLAFKKAVLEEGRHLVSSQQWECVIEYVILAWEQVAATPLWDNPPHNAPRRQCFKFLAAQCMNALKKVQSLPTDQIGVLQAKLQTFSGDSDDIQACLKYLDQVKRK